MKSAILIRWGALAAVASGVLWIIWGLLTLAYPQTPPDVPSTRLDYLGTFVLSAAYLGVLGGLVRLRARQVDSYGSLGEAGFLLAFIGAALLCVAHGASTIFGGPGALGWLLDEPGYGLMVTINLLLAGVGGAGHRDATGEGAAPLVRLGAHRRGGRLGLWRDREHGRSVRGGWSAVDGAGLRPLVSKGRVG